MLAISGMNMAFLTGFVFALFRYGLALIPYVALRVNTKKVAAVVSLAVALFYLLLSGANVATERAFIMISVVLGAVLLDRRALSLRSVALSAVVLLALRPESLLDAGFQMSFAATTALIAGFGALEGGVLRGLVMGSVVFLRVYIFQRAFLCGGPGFLYSQFIALETFFRSSGSRVPHAQDLHRQLLHSLGRQSPI